ALRGGTQLVQAVKGSLLVIERSGGGERFAIVANLSALPVTYDGPGSDTPDLVGGGGARLRPWQTALFALPPQAP
ncbi:hypothetical protein, partial [Caulobacter sp. HMWF025]